MNHDHPTVGEPAITHGTLEFLLATIHRARCEPSAPGDFDDSDREYAQNLLDAMVPGLANYVLGLPYSDLDHRHAQLAELLGVGGAS